MDTAIVTITCPNCGGKVEGITATNAAQKVPCKYCNTELHVPRIGDEIVRETKIVHEVREVYTPPLPIVNLRSPPSPIVPVILVAVVAAGLFLVVLSRHRSSDVLDRFETEQADQTQCEQSCTSQCANAPPREHSSPDIGDPELQQKIDKTMREADITLCESDCKMKADCFHLNKH